MRMDYLAMADGTTIGLINLRGEKMNHEQLVINNLGLEIANNQVSIADLRAQLELKNQELNQANLTIENLKKENDSLRNSYEQTEDEVSNNG